jgi:phosphoglycolate phosphatase
MRFSAVLFDLDGTLLNTIEDLADAANGMLADMKLPQLPVDTVQGYVGKGTGYLVSQCIGHAQSIVAGHTPPPPSQRPALSAQQPFPTPVRPGLANTDNQALVQHGLQLFADHYRRCSGRKTVLYPGVLEGLEAFRGQGMKMAIVTNKPTEFTPPLLQRAGIAGFFEQVVCGDTCEQKKPHPMPFLHACAQLRVSPQQALAIGDSVNDAQAAQAAGITVLAVPYGYNGGRDVRDFKVDDIVTSIDAAAEWAAQHQDEQRT